MQKYQIKLSNPAKIELDAIGEYIAREYWPYYARNTVDRIYRKILSLDTFPKRKKISDDPEFWMAHTKSFNIIYSIDDVNKTVYIHHIISAKQDYTRFI